MTLGLPGSNLQPVSIRYTARLIEAGVALSVGGKGNSYELTGRIDFTTARRVELPTPE